MGYTGTTNYGFQKPAKENAFTVDDLNNALDKIDETIKARDDAQNTKNTEQDNNINGKQDKLPIGVSGQVWTAGNDGAGIWKEPAIQNPISNHDIKLNNIIKTWKAKSTYNEIGNLDTNSGTIEPSDYYYIRYNKDSTINNMMPTYDIDINNVKKLYIENDERFLIGNTTEQITHLYYVQPERNYEPYTQANKLQSIFDSFVNVNSIIGNKVVSFPESVDVSGSYSCIMLYVFGYTYVNTWDYRTNNLSQNGTITLDSEGNITSVNIPKMNSRNVICNSFANNGNLYYKYATLVFTDDSISKLRNKLQNKLNLTDISEYLSNN